MKHAQDYHAVPLLASVDLGATDTGTAFVNMANALWAEFHVNFGVITGDSLTLTVEEATTNASGAEVAIPFTYRTSSPVGTDSLGAVATADSNGATVAATDDNTLWVVSVDPASLDDGYNYVRLWLNLGGSMSVCLASAEVLLNPRYPSASPISAS